jgi:transposase
MSPPPQPDSHEEGVPISDVVARLEALVAALQAQISAQQTQIAALQARNAELERRLGLNSGNSGKPPSSSLPLRRRGTG